MSMKRAQPTHTNSHFFKSVDHLVSQYRYPCSQREIGTQVLHGWMPFFMQTMAIAYWNLFTFHSFINILLKGKTLLP